MGLIHLGSNSSATFSQNLTFALFVCLFFICFQILLRKPLIHVLVLGVVQDVNIVPVSISYEKVGMDG